MVTVFAFAIELKYIPTRELDNILHLRISFILV